MFVIPYKLFDKLEAFPFFIVRMLYIDNNIPKSIFHSALVGKFLRIARSSLLYKDFNEKAMELKCRKALSKIIPRHEKAFPNFAKNSF